MKSNTALQERTLLSITIWTMVKMDCCKRILGSIVILIISALLIGIFLQAFIPGFPGLFAFLPGGPDETIGPCPLGWSSLAIGCYRFLKADTFQDAKISCTREGGLLVGENSQYHQEGLSKFYKDSGIIGNVWLGATDSVKEGDWKWINTDQPITVNSWSKGEPKNFQGRNEDCIFWDGSWNLESWNAVSCDWKNKNINALCEYPGNWGEWGPWSEMETCTRPCGGGKHRVKTSRSCNSPTRCTGESNKTIEKNCNTRACKSTNKEPAIVYKYTNAYDIIWKDSGSGGSKDGAIWRPKNYQSEYCLLGDVATNGYKAPSQTAIIVSAKKSGALVPPSSFSRVWKDSGSGASWDGAVYKMNAPAGYTCLGGVAMRSHSSQPDRNKYCCVKNDYIVSGEVQLVYDDKGTGSHADLSLWTVIRGSDAYGLDGGNFIPVNGYGRPSHGYLLKEDEVTVKNAWSLEVKEIKPLKLFQVSELKKIWDDSGSGAHSDVSIWRTEVKKGYYSLGDIAIKSHSQPPIGFLLKPSTPQYNDAIRAPVSYSSIWNDGGSGADDDVTIWRVNCPGGYVALGNVATDGTKPALTDIACVKRKYVESGYNNGNGWQLIWKDHGSGASSDVSIFQAKEAKQTQQTALGIGAIASHRGYPGTPYLLKKSEHTYSSEKPIERIEMSNVQYDLKAEKRLPARPIFIQTITIINSSNKEQTSEKTISFEKSESISFEFTLGIELGVELRCEAGIPGIGGTETTISVSLTSTFTTGKSNTNSTCESVTAQINTPGNSKITATVTGTQYTANIPYTAHIKKIYYDGSTGQADITGIFHGVSVSEAYVTYGEIEKI